MPKPSKPARRGIWIWSPGFARTSKRPPGRRPHGDPPAVDDEGHPARGGAAAGGGVRLASPIRDRVADLLPDPCRRVVEDDRDLARRRRDASRGKLLGGAQLERVRGDCVAVGADQQPVRIAGGRWPGSPTRRGSGPRRRRARRCAARGRRSRSASAARRGAAPARTRGRPGGPGRAGRRARRRRRGRGAGRRAGCSTAWRARRRCRTAARRGRCRCAGPPRRAPAPAGRSHPRGQVGEAHLQRLAAVRP